MDKVERKTFEIKKVPLGEVRKVSLGEKAQLDPVEQKLRSLGFRKTIGGWRKDWTFVVLKRQYKKGKVKPFRLFWSKNWTNFVSILIFDYSPVNGPICIIPSNALFNSPIIFEKRQTKSENMELRKLSQEFSAKDELGKFIFNYKDNWQIIK
jgi:hypothetical protein